MKSETTAIHCSHPLGWRGRDVVDDTIYFFCKRCKMTLQMVKVKDLDSYNDLQESIEVERGRDD